MRRWWVDRISGRKSGGRGEMKDLFWFLLFATLVLSSRDLENAQENVNKSFDCEKGSAPKDRFPKITDNEVRRSRTSKKFGETTEVGLA